MIKLFVILLFTGIALAQDVTTVASDMALAITSNTNSLSITASQGDGSICTITKIKSGQISALLSCQSGTTTANNMALRSTGGATVMPWGIGDVLCLLGINPTGSAVSMGSLGSIPSKGIAWSCSTNIKDSTGAVTGQTPIVNGSAVWP